MVEDLQGIELEEKRLSMRLQSVNPDSPSLSVAEWYERCFCGVPAVSRKAKCKSGDGEIGQQLDIGEARPLDIGWIGRLVQRFERRTLVSANYFGRSGSSVIVVCNYNAFR